MSFIENVKENRYTYLPIIKYKNDVGQNVFLNFNKYNEHTRVTILQHIKYNLNIFILIQFSNPHIKNKIYLFVNESYVGRRAFTFFPALYTPKS